MPTEIEDLQRIKEANFSHHVTFVAETMLVSLSGLRCMAARLGIPMEQITVQHIIDELTPMDVKIRENEKMMQSISAPRR